MPLLPQIARSPGLTVRKSQDIRLFTALVFPLFFLNSSLDMAYSAILHTIDYTLSF